MSDKQQTDRLATRRSSRIPPMLVVPVVSAALLALLYAIWLLLDLPPEETILAVARSYFDSYGLVTVYVCAAIEGLLLIGFYFPGSLVFFLGLLLAAGDPARTFQVGALAAFGLYTGYLVNYALGRHGWYRLLVAFGLRDGLERAKQRLNRHGLHAVFMTYWQPNLGSLTSTAAGVLQLAFAKFAVYSAAAVAFWIGFWSTLVYILGKPALTLVGFRFIAIMLATWIVVALIWSRIERRRRNA